MKKLMLRSPRLSFSFIVAAALAVAPVLGTAAGAQNATPPSSFQINSPGR
jgi:hypothetical protein